VSSFGPQKITTKNGKVIEITIDRQLCTGCGLCASLAPKAFALDNEFKSTVLETAGEESRENILEATKACPVAAINIKEVTAGG
jgi:ferredoxin